MLHYSKLVCRSLLFLGAAGLYIYHRIKGSEYPFGPLGEQPVLLSVIWLVYIVEMLLRFVPSSVESMGCQKQFRRNYVPTGADTAHVVVQSGWRTASVAGAWFFLNGAIGVLYWLEIIDEGILLLISLAYAVCDMICILFFCPFQSWFMKNRCCATCRIYNWDFAMMFTPLVFIPSVYTYSLLGFSLLLLLRWEITYRRHPERFSTATNRCLDCSRCEEKLCHHKKQLRGFLKKYKTRFFGRGNPDETDS